MSLNKKTKTEEELERAKVLLKAMCEICDKLDRSHYVLNFFEQTAEYDGAECDGSCLFEDAKDFLGDSKTKTVTQEEFNKAFNKILKGSTQRYLNLSGEVSKKKTSRIEVLDKNGKWLLDYDTNPKNPHFLYSSVRVHAILMENLSLEDDEIQHFMKSLAETQYKMKDTEPQISWTLLDSKAETQYKMKDTES